MAKDDKKKIIDFAVNPNSYILQRPVFFDYIIEKIMANFPKYHTILILIAIFIIKTSRSDVTSIQDLFDTIKNQTQSGRAPVNVPSLQFIDTFYGCHCRNFDQGKILADVRLATKGTPVDPVDEICQYLHNGWSCLATRDNCDIQAPYRVLICIWSNSILRILADFIKNIGTHFIIIFDGQNTL